MQDLSRIFRGLDAMGQGSPETLLTGLLLAFVLSQVVAWAYVKTHSGVSFSRSFTQSLVLMSMVVSVVMHVIGTSLVTAFGLLGALAIIRFRNVLKDTRDTTFVFFSLVLGMAIGSGKYSAALGGTFAMVGAAFYLHVTSFGARGHFDGHLRCRFEGPGIPSGIPSALARFCAGAKEVSSSSSSGSGPVEMVFQILLRDRERREEFLEMLRGTDGVQEAALVLRDELSEI